ncbi:hypothetical protein K3495_g13660, partial [Podosphaera aphanis]
MFFVHSFIHSPIRSLTSSLCLTYCLDTSAASNFNSSLKEIPRYVIDFAPFVWLDEKETFYPSDIETHLKNSAAYVDFTPVEPPPELSLHKLDALNQIDGTVFLTIKEPIERNPKFLEGTVPDENRETKGATSCVVIVTDHGDGIVDAFYMYFYSFNQGNKIISKELGNHVGDWEHNMIRFKDERPESLWYSQHADGQAFLYSAVEKMGVRPVAYSARGSHANYAVAGEIKRSIPGISFVKLPGAILADHTSRGKLWDPVKKAYFYTFDPKTNLVAPVGENQPHLPCPPQAPPAAQITSLSSTDIAKMIENSINTAFQNFTLQQAAKPEPSNAPPPPIFSAPPPPNIYFAPPPPIFSAHPPSAYSVPPTQTFPAPPPNACHIPPPPGFTAAPPHNFIPYAQVAPQYMQTPITSIAKFSGKTNVLQFLQDLE